MKCGFELLPQDFIVLVDPSSLGGINSVSELLFLGVDPVIYHRSMNISEHCQHSIKWLHHHIMGAINKFVSAELGPEFVSVATCTIEYGRRYSSHSSVRGWVVCWSGHGNIY